MKIKAVQEICNSTEKHTKLLLLCHQLKSHSDSKQPCTSSEDKPAQGNEWKKIPSILAIQSNLKLTFGYVYYYYYHAMRMIV